MALAGGALLGPCLGAAAQGPVHVAKMMLFTCSVCRATEGIDGAITSAIARNGGRFVSAPLPIDNDYAAQYYYAARDVSSGLAAKVKTSLYKAVQDMGIPLDDPFRVLVWLQQDLGTEQGVDWAALMAAAGGSEVSKALGRASRLAQAMGVSSTPGYILLKDNRPLALLDPSSVTPAGSISALRDAVLNKVIEINKS